MNKYISSARSYSLQLIVLLSLPAFLFSGCSSLMFWESKSPVPQNVRAYYVEPQNQTFASSSSVALNGDLNDIVSVIRRTITEQVDTTTSLVRLQPRERRVLGEKRMVKVKTPYVRVDSLDEFKKMFSLGTYVLDDGGVEVKAENLQYKIEAMVILRSLTYVVEFSAIAYVDWNVYVSQKNGEMKKISNSDESLVGVGEYRSKRVIRSVSRLGEPLTEYEWVTEEINDQPVSKEVIERKLGNALVENAALSGINAKKVNR